MKSSVAAQDVTLRCQQESNIADITVTAVPGPDLLSLDAAASQSAMLYPHTDVPSVPTERELGDFPCLRQSHWP